MAFARRWHGPRRTALLAALALGGSLAALAAQPRGPGMLFDRLSDGDPRVTSAQALVNLGDREGLSLQIPFKLDPEIEKAVDDAVGYGGTPLDRLRRIIRYLNDRTSLGFQYESGVSLTAVEAFHAKKGDCLAYTNLYLAIARHLRVPVTFVHIDETRDYFERSGFAFVSSHMAVGYGGGGVGSTGSVSGSFSPYMALVDFAQEREDPGMVLYESIDDATATALFYDNVAVNKMVAGDLTGAERLFRFLADAMPSVKEARNNLGVLLIREGRYGEALEVLRSALRRFPNYFPLYTNAVQAALGAHRPDVASDLQSEGRRWSERDPFSLYNQGVQSYQAGRYAEAERLFRRAEKLAPGAPAISGWLAKTLLKQGDRTRGVAAFVRAQKLAPDSPLLESLRAEFPALAAVPVVGDVAARGPN